MITNYPRKFSAGSRREFVEFLENLCIDVAPSLKDRTNDQREFYTFKKAIILRPSLVPDQLIEVVKGESPDFYLYTESRTIGIEISELRGGNSGKAQALLENEDLDIVFVGKRALQNEPVSKAELLREARQGGEGFIGDEPERLALRTLETLIDKKKKCREAAEWKSADTEYLVIYDNFGFAGCDMEQVTRMAKDRAILSGFNAVLLLSKDSIIEVSQSISPESR